jgi:hypothetical protein
MKTNTLPTRLVSALGLAAGVLSSASPVAAFCHFERVPGCATSITTAYTGTFTEVEVTGCSGTNHNIYRWKPGTQAWKQLPGRGVQVNRYEDQLYVRSSSNRIYEWNPYPRWEVGERLRPRDGSPRARVRAMAGHGGLRPGLRERVLADSGARRGVDGPILSGGAVTITWGGFLGDTSGSPTNVPPFFYDRQGRWFLP